MDLNDGDTVVYTMTAGLRATALNRRGDFMATAKVTPDKQLEAEYRFRWWNTVDKLDMDGKTDDDEKSFFVIKAGADSPEAREKLHYAFRALATSMPQFDNVYEEIGEWTPKEFVLEVLQRGPMRTQLTIEDKKP